MSKSNAARRTFQKVRRDSRLVGTVESTLWRPTNAREMKLCLRAAERFDLVGKAKGRRNGPLGHVGLQVLKALWSRVRFSDGCLCPSIDYLMRACRRSRGAIVAALRRLRSAGFLAWVRRLEYTGGPPGVRGPQVRQASNAYALMTPAAALALVGAIVMPADEITRVSEKAAALAQMEGEAFDNSPLGSAFAAWGTALGRRKASPPNASLPSARNPSSGSVC